MEEHLKTNKQVETNTF